MQTKLDEAEQLAVQGGRKVTSRLEQKIKVFLSKLFWTQLLIVTACRILRPSSMMSTDGWWRPRNLSAAQREGSRS